MDTEMFDEDTGGGGNEAFSSRSARDDSMTRGKSSRGRGRGDFNNKGSDKEWVRSGQPAGHWRGGGSRGTSEQTSRGGRGRGDRGGRGKGDRGRGDRENSRGRGIKRQSSKETFSKGSKNEMFGSALQDEGDEGYDEADDYEMDQRSAPRGTRGGRGRGTDFPRGGRAREPRGGGRGTQQQSWKPRDSAEGDSKAEYFEQQQMIAGADPKNASLFVRGSHLPSHF